MNVTGVAGRPEVAHSAGQTERWSSADAEDRGPEHSSDGGRGRPRRPPDGLEEMRRARAWLSRAVEPGRRAVHRFVAARGPVEATRLIRSGRAPEEVLRSVGARAAEDRVDDDLGAAEENGARLVIPEDEEWPSPAFHAMEVATARGVEDLAPPLALWVRGLCPMDTVLRQTVSLVGARAATEYGTYVAREMSYGLAERNWTVVSGGAVGIDAAAHRGALVAGGSTVAVMAGGLVPAYPTCHAEMFERIGTSGLLISEWPVGCTPQRHRFLIRNRLIAALGAGVVVVEAAARSGTQSTARRARELGRPVMSVPGPVTSALSTGCHQLMREHEVRAVTSASEVIEEVGPIGELAPRPTTASDPADGLEELPSRVLDAVPSSGSVSVERIAVEAGTTVAEVLRCLPALELLDLVEATAEGWRLAPNLRRRRRQARGGTSKIR